MATATQATEMLTAMALIGLGSAAPAVVGQGAFTTATGWNACSTACGCQDAQCSNIAYPFSCKHPPSPSRRFPDLACCCWLNPPPLCVGPGTAVAAALVVLGGG